jgi:hypothetical protein
MNVCKQKKGFYITCMLQKANLSSVTLVTEMTMNKPQKEEKKEFLQFVPKTTNYLSPKEKFVSTSVRGRTACIMNIKYTKSCTKINEMYTAYGDIVTVILYHCEIRLHL